MGLRGNHKGYSKILWDELKQKHIILKLTGGSESVQKKFIAVNAYREKAGRSQANNWNYTVNN